MIFYGLHHRLHPHYVQMHQTSFKLHSLLSAWIDFLSFLSMVPHILQLQNVPSLLGRHRPWVGRHHRRERRLSGQISGFQSDRASPCSAVRRATHLSAGQCPRNAWQGRCHAPSTCALALWWKFCSFSCWTSFLSPVRPRAAATFSGKSCIRL